MPTDSKHRSGSSRRVWPWAFAVVLLGLAAVLLLFRPGGDRESDGEPPGQPTGGPRERFTRETPAGPVKCLAFAPDGHTLAVGGASAAAPGSHDVPVVTLWDVATGERKATFTGRKGKQVGSVQCLAFRPGGLGLAVGGVEVVEGRSRGFVTLWDPEAGREKSGFGPHERPVTWVAFTADGTTLAAGSSDGAVRLWDVAGAKEGLSFRAHPERLTGLALSGDGSLLVTAGRDRRIKLWDLPAGKERAGLEGDASTLALTSDGRTLASAGLPGGPVAGVYVPGDVRLWDVTTRQQRAVLEVGHEGPVQALALTADDRTLVAGGVELIGEGPELAGFVTLWDLPTAKKRLAIPFPSVDSNSVRVAITPDGGVLAVGGYERKADGSATGVVTLWEIPVKP